MQEKEGREGGESGEQPSLNNSLLPSPVRFAAA